MPDEKSKLVYSTDRVIQLKKKPVENDLQASVHPMQQKVTVRLERKGRGGKSVTVIDGLQMRQKEKEAILKLLKTKLGTGGTVKDTSLEIQGDHRDALMAELGKMGYTAKRSGG
ncbi:MAG: stress response translation initiation inhibitor YciH [Nitrospirae bacterium]|jgi:translation initiation factor 1|nr:stress response translation initiation inhibitor YciH [Nitrospirota bacterium]